MYVFYRVYVDKKKNMFMWYEFGLTTQLETGNFKIKIHLNIYISLLFTTQTGNNFKQSYKYVRYS
jgi:hypothetical protein